jgi:hypothetical protein
MFPRPLEGEGGVRGTRSHSADTRLLAAGRFHPASQFKLTTMSEEKGLNCYKSNITPQTKYMTAKMANIIRHETKDRKKRATKGAPKMFIDAAECRNRTSYVRNLTGPGLPLRKDPAAFPWIYLVKVSEFK